MNLSKDEIILTKIARHAVRINDMKLFHDVQENLKTNYNLEIFPTGTGGTMIRRIYEKM